jgi:hypothetical protein
MCALILAADVRCRFDSGDAAGYPACGDASPPAQSDTGCILYAPQPELLCLLGVAIAGASLELMCYIKRENARK